MRIFFLFLASVTTLLLLLALTYGFDSDLNQSIGIFNDAPSTMLTHFYFGLIATVSALVTHTWVFFYFIGTGEGIREGILENRLDTAAIKRTKKFKGMTFPFALFSMIFLIVTSILGGALRFGKVHPNWHLGLALLATAFNLFAFYQEARVIKENEKLMRSLNASLETHSSM